MAGEGGMITHGRTQIIGGEYVYLHVVQPMPYLCSALLFEPVGGPLELITFSFIVKSLNAP